MKRIILAVAALVFAAGCTQENGISLGNARKLNDSCTPGTETELRGSGQFDTAVTNSYIASFEVVSSLEARTIQVGSDVLLKGNQNDAILNQLVLNYATTPATSLKQEILPLLFRVSAGSTTNFLTTDVIGPQAKEAIRARVAANGDQMQILVRVQLKGNLASGSPISSNEVLFPVRAYFYDPGCGGTLTGSPTGACGNNGQDESIASCGTTP